MAATGRTGSGPVRLEDVGLPGLSDLGPCPEIPADEYRERRLQAHATAGADWLVVYGDREHNANLLHLAGLDPRFEELLLLLGPRGEAVAVAGNEMPDYVRALAPSVEVVSAQTFGLMGQDRSRAPRLADSLRAAGIRAGDSIGVVGWKYLEREECADPARPAFVPAVLVDELRAVSGSEPFDATRVLMDPGSGLRAVNSAAQIALFEWGATRASQAVWRIVEGTRPGMTERRAAALMDYAGEPLTAHVMLASGGAGDDGGIVGLRSPSDRTLVIGDGITTAIGFAGGLTCRAGRLAEEIGAEGWPLAAAYFGAIAAFWQTLAIGVTGAAIREAAMAPLAGVGLRPALNPGHLGSYEEWLHSPVAPGSEIRVRSGAVFQTDIIPVPMPRGLALNCEDAVAVADEALRAELRTSFPGLWARVEARRAAITERIGLSLAPELLPLSDRAACFAPAWLRPGTLCVLR